MSDCEVEKCAGTENQYLLHCNAGGGEAYGTVGVNFVGGFVPPRCPQCGNKLSCVDDTDNE